MSEVFSELRRLPNDEVIRRHDHAAQTTVVGLAHYLQELARRDAERQLVVTTR